MNKTRCHCGDEVKRCIICGFGIPGAVVTTDPERIKVLKRKHQELKDFAAACADD
jgi:hypothetical protein